ncbi:uncharacterized protein LOC129587737 isoform X2 [Paramacrobiotus metropolitanus]|uniref:uncharacterized protein LOC129587737 isoform X2 n=1 Tax=Paramacrobiotus metropolitanus TaxID=2943436 RepID=UPI002445833F|nr:uncharacterized protein LOC129587737 isoform X2 [Paramacrobiotus metropolitanus]
MDYQKPQIKTESIRLRIKADVPADYFHQPMAIARGPDGVVYLRIGDDIYEGRAVLENTDGTAVHFDVAEISSNEAEGATASGRLANFAVSDFEYQFCHLAECPVPHQKRPKRQQ